jgi:hypothetical protein
MREMLIRGMIGMLRDGGLCRSIYRGACVARTLDYWEDGFFQINGLCLVAGSFTQDFATIFIRITASRHVLTSRMAR